MLFDKPSTSLFLLAIWSYHVSIIHRFRITTACLAHATAGEHSWTISWVTTGKTWHTNDFLLLINKSTYFPELTQRNLRVTQGVARSLRDSRASSLPQPPSFILKQDNSKGYGWIFHEIWRIDRLSTIEELIKFWKVRANPNLPKFNQLFSGWG